MGNLLIGWETRRGKCWLAGRYGLLMVPLFSLSIGMSYWKMDDLTYWGAIALVSYKYGLLKGGWTGLLRSHCSGCPPVWTTGRRMNWSAEILLLWSPMCMNYRKEDELVCWDFVALVSHVYELQKGGWTALLRFCCSGLPCVWTTERRMNWSAEILLLWSPMCMNYRKEHELVFWDNCSGYPYAWTTERRMNWSTEEPLFLVYSYRLLKHRCPNLLQSIMLNVWMSDSSDFLILLILLISWLSDSSAFLICLIVWLSGLLVFLNVWMSEFSDSSDSRKSDIQKNSPAAIQVFHTSDSPHFRQSKIRNSAQPSF